MAYFLKSSRLSRALLLAGAGLAWVPGLAIATPQPINIELPEKLVFNPTRNTAETNVENTANREGLAQVNVRVEGVGIGDSDSQGGVSQGTDIQDNTVETVQQTQAPSVNIRTPKLPNIRPQITPQADIDLGPARVNFPRSTTPSPSVTSPASTSPAITTPTVSNPIAPAATPHSTLTEPVTSNSAPVTGAVRPGMGGAAVPAPYSAAPAVINLTTFQPNAGGFSPTAAYGGATQAAAPSNVQLVCTPGAFNAQRPGGVAQVSQGGAGAGAGVGAGVNGGLAGGVAGGLAQQTVGSVLNAGGAVQRPGLFGGLIPNPTVGVDVGPVTLDVPIPISALFGRGRNGNQANQGNPTGVVPAVNNPVPGAPVTTASAGGASTAGAGTAQPGAYPVNNPYAVPPMAYPVANVGGGYGGAMPVMTQVVTSQHTIINFTTLQPVSNSGGSRATNVGLNTAADAPAMQASTVQLVCNPGG